MILHELVEWKVAKLPRFVPDNTHYIVMMGSQAYGVANADSDRDMYGWAIPPKENIFPHLAGVIPGFGEQIQPWDQWQQHRMFHPLDGCEYDFTIYNVTKFFQLVMDGNPNMIDALFVPENCVIHCTAIGRKVRDHRHLFLHKGCWQRFRGYAYEQIKKCKSQKRVGSRVAIVEKYGYDVKFASHCVRLLDEIEQILTTGKLDLTRDRERIKSIRRGEWALEKVEAFFEEKTDDLERAYHQSALPEKPNEKAIRDLLFEVLEDHYGDITSAVVRNGGETLAFHRIAEIIEPFLDVSKLNNTGSPSQIMETVSGEDDR